MGGDRRAGRSGRSRRGRAGAAAGRRGQRGRAVHRRGAPPHAPAGVRRGRVRRLGRLLQRDGRRPRGEGSGSDRGPGPGAAVHLGRRPRAPHAAHCHRRGGLAPPRPPRGHATRGPTAGHHARRRRGPAPRAGRGPDGDLAVRRGAGSAPRRGRRPQVPRRGRWSGPAAGPTGSPWRAARSWSPPIAGGSSGWSRTSWRRGRPRRRWVLARASAGRRRGHAGGVGPAAGIPPSTCPPVRPALQGRPGRATSGSGLGLAIAAETPGSSAGGSTCSVVGTGSRFTLRLPVAKPLPGGMGALRTEPTMGRRSTRGGSDDLEPPHLHRDPRAGPGCGRRMRPEYGLARPGRPRDREPARPRRLPRRQGRARRPPSPRHPRPAPRAPQTVGAP